MPSPEIIKVEGRTVYLDVEARDEKELIGDGLHERVVVNVEKFALRVRASSRNEALTRVVLGAGIVGISVALHLQARGRSVALVDRRGAAEETSFGNAGLIQREGVYPYGFPHDFGALLRYGLNRTIDAHYHPSALPELAPFLWKYWKHSRRERHARSRACTRA